MNTIDLATLPAPTVVQALDFESILAQARADLLARYPAAADVIDLESEPLRKLMEVHAYRELLIRQRINEAARAHLLAYASGTDLDHKGAFYGLPRMTGEADNRFRQRIQLRIRSLAGNGTREHYQLLAMSASANVRDALASQPGAGQVRVLLCLIDATQAEASVLAVSSAIQAEAARPLGVTVSVAVARPRPVHISAAIWREATAPANLVEQLRTSLPLVMASYARLGRSVPRSWVTAQLHVVGVAAVHYLDEIKPEETTTLAADEYPALGALNLIDKGVVA
ncbi:baseplate J protein [Verminephrobacter aporrectodeae subsp. tuberculatae]|uniref:Baseplate J protein n=1 Tax=Verminephrobacter aporrectodeae subsp. tuberculatae TaxID=1110392 RepID=A0ABT3KQF7_9BURK|nr:baseplate J/gp47 family protein [Verminephrobacter aporrectodeae]MCW5320548.1 baseplate J protein [Verminephrobacter aporrectodeae subsp. tuberculatae]